MKKHPLLFFTAKVVLLAFTLGSGVALALAGPTIFYTANDVVLSYTPPGPPTVFATLPFTSPQGLAFDTSGNLFVAGSGNVSKITPAGVVSVFATMPPGSFGGYGMAIDAANNLYVAGAASLQIIKVTPGGAVSVYATLATGTTGMAIDNAGNLYKVGGGYDVLKIPAGGGAASIYATLGGNNLYGLAFDASGYLYASDLTQANLYKIPPGGGSYTTIGPLIAGSDGLTFDQSGNLYAAHLYADAISKITPDGTASVIGTSLSGPRYLVVKPDPFVLQITAVNKVGNDLRLNFTSQTGFNYAIQSRADLSSDTWVTLAGTTNSGTGGIMQQTLTNALVEPQQFYRVQQLP